MTAGPTLIFARAHGGDFANECRCFNVETRKLITVFNCQRMTNKDYRRRDEGVETA